MLVAEDDRNKSSIINIDFSSILHEAPCLGLSTTGGMLLMGGMSSWAPYNHMRQDGCIVGQADLHYRKLKWPYVCNKNIKFDVPHYTSSCFCTWMDYEW